MFEITFDYGRLVTTPFSVVCFQGVDIIPCSLSKAGGRDRRHDGGSPCHTVHCSRHLSYRLDLIHASTCGS